MSDQFPPTFTFKQVEAIFAAVFHVVGAKRATFVARLQQLQKLGIPQGAQVGRGAKVAYTPIQMAEMLLALDMINAGTTPALALKALRGGFHGVEAQSLCNIAEQERPLSKDGRYLHIFLGGLQYLTVEDPTQDGPQHGYAMLLADDGGTMVAEIENYPPRIVINFSERIAVLKSAIADVRPDLAGAQIFPPAS